MNNAGDEAITPDNSFSLGFRDDDISLFDANDEDKGVTMAPSKGGQCGTSHDEDDQINIEDRRTCRDV